MTRTIDGHTMDEDGCCIHNCAGCEAEYRLTHHPDCPSPPAAEVRQAAITMAKLATSAYGDLPKACYALALVTLPEAINLAEGDYDTARNRVLSLCLCWYDVTVAVAMRAVNEAEKQLQDWGVIQ